MKLTALDRATERKNREGIGSLGHTSGLLACGSVGWEPEAVMRVATHSIGLGA